MKEVRYSLTNTKLDSIIQNGKICFKSVCQRFESYQPHFTRDAVYLTINKDEYRFRLVYGVSERVRKSDPPYFYEYKSVVNLNIKYKNKKMLVRLDFTKNQEKLPDDEDINLVINFKEGTYKVKDPKKPKLVKIKSD